MARGHDGKLQRQTLPKPSIEPIIETDDEMSGMKFSYDINGKRIALLVSYDAPSQYDQRETSVPAQYLERYDEASWWSDGAHDGSNAIQRTEAILDEMQEMICEVCYTPLMELAGSLLPALQPEMSVATHGNEAVETDGDHSRSAVRTLHDYMYPDNLVTQLVSQDGELKLVRRDDLPPPVRYPALADIAALEDKANSKVTTYTPSQIQVVKSYLFHPWIL
jgi:hypothetical protein